MDKIEEYSEKPFSDSVAEHLNVYRGAYKALCMLDKKKAEEWSAGAYYADKKEKTADRAGYKESTPELDGDTEFEQVIMKIPADRTHMVKITHIFDKHLQGLKMVNARAYNNIMEQLWEVAKS